MIFFEQWETKGLAWWLVHWIATGRSRGLNPANGPYILFFLGASQLSSDRVIIYPGAGKA